MIVALDEFIAAVERVRDVINENKNDNASVLFRLDKEASKLLVAYADGTKAVCSNISIEIEDTDRIETEIVAPFKYVSEAVEVVKPTGIILVDTVKIDVDPDRQNISFEAEKYINMAEDENATETTKQVISVMNRSFGYKRMEEDKRQRVLGCVNYEDMLASDKIVSPDADVSSMPEVATWGRTDLINVLQKMTAEDATIIFSEKAHSVRVAYTGYAVYVPKEEIAKPLCINTKTAKTLMAVLKHCGTDTVDMQVDTNQSTTVRTADGTVAIWFTNVSLGQNMLKRINAYSDNSYDKHRLVVIRDAIVNQIKCLGEDVSNVELSFTGSAVEGYKMIVGGGVNATKSNQFSIALSAAEGENEELTSRKFTVNTETIKGMLSLCETTFVGIEIDLGKGETQDGAWVMRICDITKTAGIVERGTQCFTVVAMKANG